MLLKILQHNYEIICVLKVLDFFYLAAVGEMYTQMNTSVIEVNILKI